MVPITFDMTANSTNDLLRLYERLADIDPSTGQVTVTRLPTSDELYLIELYARLHRLEAESLHLEAERLRMEAENRRLEEENRELRGSATH